ncbi:MAG TPA: hypothetical protein VEY08_00970, partial [Chloroflexia bacterium]|nr:hypothetical protein [Chloroflexia bacterium]
APAIPELLIYRLPRFGVKYVIGADPAEGNPTSDDSSFTVQNKLTGEVVASLSGKFQPDTFAQHIATVSRYYNRAGVLPERNNHGHAVILALRKDAPYVPLLMGLDGEPGWLTTTPSKAAMFDDAAKAFKEGDTTLYTLNTYLQLAGIEGATNRAPKEEHDDAAIGFALCLLARSRRPATTHQSNYLKDAPKERTVRDIWEDEENAD